MLEALGSTDLNLLIDVGFNREVAQNAALYWGSDEGELAGLIDEADAMDEEERIELSKRAKERIKRAYSWQLIGDEYKRVWI